MSSWALIFEVIFVTLTESSSVKSNDTQRPRKYPHHQKYLWRHTSMRDMALKMSRYFYLMMEKPLGCYFQVCSPFYQAVQCDHKTPIPLSSRAQVRSKKTKKISSLITAASIYRCNKYIYPIRYFQCCTITVRVTNEGERDTMSCPYEARLIPLNINPIFKCL